MAATEGVEDVLLDEFDFGGLARGEGFGLVQAVAEFAAEDVSPDKLPVAAELVVELSRRVGIGIKVRIDVNQLHNPIAIGPGGGRKQPGPDRSGESEVFFQHVAGVHEHVWTAAGGALVFGHVGLGHAESDSGHQWDGLFRVACVFIESGVGGFFGRIERQFAVSAKIERF